MFWRINKMKDCEFFSMIDKTEDIIEIFKELDIIPEKKKCVGCKKIMVQQNKKTEKLGIIWYCSSCKKHINVLVDSEFYNLRFPLKNILKFTYYFFRRDHFKQSSILENCELSDEGYLTLLNLFRRKIKKFINDNPISMGGPFKEIQIDESHWAKRKYGIGRYSEPIWIFGMIEVKSNIVYLETVKSREAKTLIPIIKSKIEKGSYIISDQMSGYNSLEQCGYFRNTVCHKKTL
ncbi:hypothetical protein DMUE_1799 [Dictyocoela muelleri]|nr:hypothetical protein DMUE_1799 [Dictyocoela muelleri]